MCLSKYNWLCEFVMDHDTSLVQMCINIYLFMRLTVPTVDAVIESNVLVLKYM